MAQAIAEIYAEAERRLIEQIRRRLERGIDAPDWATRKLAEIQELRREVDEVLRETQREVEETAEEMVQEAYDAGSAEAEREIRVVVQPQKPVVAAFGRTHKHAVVALARKLIDTLAATHLRILRDVEDVYREITTAEAAQILTGAMTRREATQAMLDRFAERGITGFVDRAGRSWNLSSYAEMAARSISGQAAIQGHINRLLDYGYNLVIVSDSPEECPRCRPWERRVLRTTNTGPSEYLHINDAIAAGLFHPNCTHSVGLYVPGVTRLQPAHSNPEGYELRQQQRYMERKIREWKRREAAAITEEQRKYARAKVREWQDRIREFCEEHNRKRLYYREQI